MFNQNTTQQTSSDYILSGTAITSGWNDAMDPNNRNSFGMSPVQVAIQAGNLVEFKSITESPSFDPNSMGDIGVFFEICKKESADDFSPMTKNAYAELRSYFDNNFLTRFNFCTRDQMWKRVSH